MIPAYAAYQNIITDITINRIVPTPPVQGIGILPRVNKVAFPKYQVQNLGCLGLLVYVEQPFRRQVQPRDCKEELVVATNDHRVDPTPDNIHQNTIADVIAKPASLDRNLGVAIVDRQNGRRCIKIIQVTAF